MKYSKLLAATCAQINEIMPWDLNQYLQNNQTALVVDVRQTSEYRACRVQGSINVPRGILENASNWGFSETIPELASAKRRPVLVVCRSGHRSAFAALTLQQLDFEQVYSLKLGVKGLNDEDYPLIGGSKTQLDADVAEQLLNPFIREDQLEEREVDFVKSI